MSITINGQVHEISRDPRTSLLDYLRDHLGLTGTKKGCDQGACGACTVLVDKERILSCLALAIQYEGRSITTIEGVSLRDSLHPLQQAFITCEGLQCGYCTPGQIMSAIGMAGEVKRGLPSAVSQEMENASVAFTQEEIAERMSGNLCRCGAYNGIIDAIVETYVEADDGREMIS